MLRTHLILILFSVILAGCGGSSSSGGGQEADIRAVVGVYEGEFTVTFTLAGQTSVPTSNPLLITVAGQGATQEAIIAFQQFSGSSAVGTNLDFFIPSGTFRLSAGNGEFCQGTLNFSGVFTVTPPAASGTVTGSFRCPGIPQALAADGTFTVNLAN